MDVRSGPGPRHHRRRGGIALVAAAALMALLVTACPKPAPLACGAEGRWDGVAPIAAGDARVRSIQATSDVAGSLAESATLFVRVTFAGDATPEHLVFLDTDGDRMTGMWTSQSAVSSAGWNLLVDAEGRLHRHEGSPNAWSWAAIDDDAYGRSVNGATVDLCIPVRALAPDGVAPQAVRIGALVDPGDGTPASWLPLTFLPGAPYPGLDVPSVPSEPVAPPGTLAFAYMREPWLVRDCADPDPVSMGCPADVYGGFDHVVFAAGLEEPSHDSHDKAAALIAALRERHPGTEVWGYVSMIGRPDFDGDGRRDEVYTVEAIRKHAEQWRAMGATGVFLDEDGLCQPEWADCPVGADGVEVVFDRARQAAVATAIHDAGLAVFANAFSIEDVLGDVDGVPTPLGPGTADRPTDMYLMENPTIAEGAWRTGLDAEVSRAKFALAVQLRAATGVRVAAVDTAAGAVGPDATAAPGYAAAWWRAAQANLDAYGFTNPGYSAPPELATDLASLGQPADAAEGYGAAFEPGGLVFTDAGATSLRSTVDADGNPLGTIRFAEIPDGAEAGFVPG